MRIYSPLFLLGALGVLSAASAAAAPDTSAWKCESCPYPKGTTGAVEVGVGTVSESSAKFGDYTGLDSDGAYLLLNGDLSHRGESGYFADLSATDLGIDARTFEAKAGREGLYSLRLGYGEIPRHFADDAMTPFLGNGGKVLTLPNVPGFPADTTAAMPLSTTLQPVELGYNRTRVDLGGKWLAGENWSFAVDLRKDRREGTRSLYGSFFSTASQLAAPVDDATDQLELSANYSSRQLQVKVAYQLSQYKNENDSLTWTNPFTAVVPVQGGVERGQLALAPDNQFHQIMGTAAYQISPTMRASADIAVGRMTQNADYLPSTLNPGLAATVPPLPAPSLDGRVDTFNAGVKLSAAPLDGLRLNASYARNVHDNATDILSYPRVATDMFLRPEERSNTPFDFTQDLFKLTADYRATDEIKLSGGAEHDRRDRNFQEAVTTRETTLWGRMGMQASEDVAFSLKLAFADRDHSTFGTAVWYGYPENPLLRRYNLAARQRQSAAVRADFVVAEGVSLGLDADVSVDDYKDTQIGLTYGLNSGFGADLSAAISEQWLLQVYGRSDRMYSKQAGSERSEQSGQPDWFARNKDNIDMLGLGLRYAAIKDKLDLGADFVFTRSDNDVEMDTTAGTSAFPTATTSMDSFKIFGTYRLRENLSVTASFWHERYKSQDWRLDGVQPATVPSLLTFGVQPPQYSVNVVRLALRYGF